MAAVRAPVTDPSQRIGAVIDGRFRLEKLLGVGGMGAVYVAIATNGHRYAVKLLAHDRFASSREMVARFVREAKLAASVTAPNVVHTYDCSIDPETGSPLMAMELLDGFDCDSLVQRLGAIEPTIAVRLILQAAKGLSAAHHAGIIHRDIKPANLFLHRAAAAGDRGHELIVKVCDFGIAKAIVADDESLTVTGTPLGTPLYLSPEQMRSAKHVDPRTDVWSLGMTLWTMLAGRPALGGSTSISDLFLAICTQDVPWIQDVAPWVDPDLAKVIHGTLLRDVPQRCPDLGALSEALSRFSQGTDQVFEGDLVSLHAQSRSQSAPRTSRVQSWSESVPRADANAADPVLRALLGRSLAGRYRLDKLLGAGGMGAVFEATAVNGTRVAAKVILGDPERQKPELLRRFVREARATMAIDSPNVVRIVDVDSDPQAGFPFIVMELLAGTDLDKLIRTKGALDPVAVAKLFVQACTGLGAAHGKGILHRDVKPANVFLHQSVDGRIQVKICDFGIAKQLNGDEGGVVSTELTRTGGVLGSPMYMSPEQARSAKHVDATTDVWSLGAALYEALSGRRVWEGHSSVGDLIIAICTKEVPPLQDVAPWVDPGLAEVVHRALQREPGARHASMQAFAAALAPFAGAGVLAIDALESVPTKLRAVIAPRNTGVGGSTSIAASAVAATAPRPARFGVAAGVFLAVAVVGAGAAIALRPGATPPPASASLKPPAEAEAKKDPRPLAPFVAAKVRVKVSIVPATAEVTVDGKAPPELADGTLVLEGEAGDAFQVVAKVGTRTTTKQIFIGKDGKPSIDSIEVTADKAVSKTQPAVAPTKPPKEPPTAAAIQPSTASVVKPPPTMPAPTAPPTPPPPAGTPIGASTF